MPKIDYSQKCIRCGDDGVVVTPWGYRGKICLECALIAFEDLFAVSEAYELLATGIDDATATDTQNQ